MRFTAARLASLLLVITASNSVMAREYLVDFGSSRNQSPSFNSTSGAKGWNNMTSGQVGNGIANLKDTFGIVSDVSMTITDSFWQQSPGMGNSDGTTQSKLFPGTATADSFFVGTYDGYSDDSAKVRLGGLNAEGKYTVRLYASRMTLNTADRTTIYTINGISHELQVRNNVDNIVEFSGVSPVNQSIEITIARKAGSVFGYLGVLQLIESSNSSPTAYAGTNKTISLPQNSVVLSGSGSDVDGTIIGYHWAKVSGGAATIVTPSAASTTVNDLTEGSYDFRLTVIDNIGAIGSSDVLVTVKKASEVSVVSATIVLPKTQSIYLPDLSSYHIKPGDTIVIPAGTYTGITLGGFHGTADQHVKIINSSGGRVVSPYLRIRNATYFSVSGSGSANEYGFLLGAKTSNASMGTGEAVSDFEVERVECKDSTCGFFFKINPDPLRPLTYSPNWIMKNISIHHNYIHDIHGEGMYIGDTNGNGGKGGTDLIPVRLSQVKIHDNLVESTDWDGIQLATARDGAEIYNNKVRNYGLTDKATQQAGIILGGSTTGKIHDNWIENGTGNGIQYFGYGNGEITHNTLIHAGTTSYSDAIFINQVLNTVEQDAPLSILVNGNQIVEPGRIAVRNGNYEHLEIAGKITNNMVFDASFSGKSSDMFASNAGDLISSNLINPVSVAAAKPTQSNIAPTVSAGPDQKVSKTAGSFTLIGSASDSDGRICAYRWSKVSGPSASFSSSGSSMKVTNIQIGTYLFKLIVNDDQAAIATDEVTVTVK